MDAPLHGVMAVVNAAAEFALQETALRLQSVEALLQRLVPLLQAIVTALQVLHFLQRDIPLLLQALHMGLQLAHLPAAAVIELLQRGLLCSALQAAGLPVPGPSAATPGRGRV